jgi:heme-degrading monooxygenase HmoA
MVIVVFRTHVKPQADLAQLNALNQRMVALVSQMPGFVSLKDFAAQDGEFLVLAEFDSLESVDAWKAHPEHHAAQWRGREEVFAEYRIQVCHVLRTADFTAASGQEHPDKSTRTQLESCLHFIMSRIAARPHEGVRSTGVDGDAVSMSLNVA